jgi:hypothetical protein
MANGLAGVMRGLESASQHAQQVSEAFRPESEVGPVEPIVGLMVDSLQVEASTKVIQVGNLVTRRILDLFA